MQLILQYIISTIIFCPIIVLLIVFFSAKKFKYKSSKAFGYGADATTFVFLFSVPLAIYSIWQFNIAIYFLLGLIFIAIIVTYREWRIEKELEVMIVLRKVWRLYFLLLFFVYMGILFVGLIRNIVIYSWGQAL